MVQLHAYTLATTKIAEENLVRVSDIKDLLHYLAAKEKRRSSGMTTQKSSTETRTDPTGST